MPSNLIKKLLSEEIFEINHGLCVHNVTFCKRNGEKQKICLTLLSWMSKKLLWKNVWTIHKAFLIQTKLDDIIQSFLASNMNSKEQTYTSASKSQQQQKMRPRIKYSTTSHVPFTSTTSKEDLSSNGQLSQEPAQSQDQQLQQSHMMYPNGRGNNRRNTYQRKNNRGYHQENAGRKSPRRSYERKHETNFMSPKKLELGVLVNEESTASSGLCVSEHASTKGSQGLDPSWIENSPWENQNVLFSMDWTRV